MTNVGGVVFDVLPIFKDFEKKLTAGVSKAAEKASKDAKPIEPKIDTKEIESAFSKLGDLGRVVAGVAIVAGLKHAIDTGTEWAKTVNSIRRATGDSIEDSSRLAFVLDRVGITAESAAPQLAVLNRNLQQGGANFKQYFDAATLAELRVSTFSKQLPILAEAYQKLNTAQEKTTFLQNTFGRSGVQFGKLLELQTADFAALANEAERFGLVLTAANAASFKEFIATQRAAEQASKGLQVQIGQLTLPVFEAFDNVMIKVLTTLTSLPAPVQALIGVLAIGAVGIGKYGQALQSTIDLAKGAAAGIRKIADAQKAASAASAAAAATTAGATATSAAVTAGAAAAGPAATAAGAALGTILTASVVGAIAAGGIIIAGALDKALSDAREREQIINEGNELRVRAIKAGGGGQKEIDAATAALKELQEAGRLTPEVIHVLSSSDTAVRIRRTVEAGGDLPALLREIVAESEAAAKEAAVAGDSIADFAGATAAAQAAADGAAAAEKTFEEGLRAAGTAGGAGAAVIAAYAQELFEAAEAAAAASGAEFDRAGALRDAAAAAVKAAEEFGEAEKKRAEAAKEAAEKTAESAKDAAEKVADAQENLNETIREGQKKIADAEENLQEAIADGIEARKDAEESLAEARADAVEQEKDAREQLADFERNARERTKDGIEQIRDAEQNLLDIRQQSADAIRDANISLEEALIGGDAAAINRAQLALTEARLNGADSVKDAEADVTKARQDAQKEERDILRERKKLEEDLAKARLDALKRIKEAQEDLKDTIKDANKRVKEAQEAVVEARKDAAKANEEAREQLIELTAEAKKYADEAERAARAWERIRQAQVDSATAYLGGGGFSLTGLAHGGDIPRGGAFVGEEGIEYVSGPGHVTSNDDLIRALKGKGSTASVTNNVTINEVSGSARATWRKIEPFLVRGVNV